MMKPKMIPRAGSCATPSGGNSGPAPAGIRPRTVWRDGFFWLMLAIIAVIQTVTMPALIYPGDNYTPRSEAVNLLMTGQLGIRYGDVDPARFGDALTNKGQYYFSNDARQKLFSKYGIAYTLAYLPPLSVERLCTGSLDLFGIGPALMLIINIYQILLTLLAAGYLFRLAALYTDSRGGRVAFVLTSIYATFLWHYLRAPTLEIFQLSVFPPFAYYLLRFIRDNAKEASPSTDSWRHLRRSVLLAGVLLLMKPLFALLFAGIGMFALLIGAEPRGVGRRAAHNLRAHAGRYAWFMVLPTLVMVAAWMLANRYRFGSVWSTGYGQWETVGGVGTDRWSLRFLWPSFQGLFLRPGNANVFIHYPLLVPALIMWPAFIRRHGREAALMGYIILSNLAALMAFSSWTGEWCYGPRYFILILILASLPAVLAWTWPSAPRRRAARIGGAVVATGVLAWSILLQVDVNAMPYFTFYYVRDWMEPFHQPAIQRYLESKPTRALLHREVRLYVRGQRPFVPLTMLDEALPPDQLSPLGRHRRRQFTRALQTLKVSNFLWFPD